MSILAGLVAFFCFPVGTGSSAPPRRGNRPKSPCGRKSMSAISTNE